MPTFNPQTFLKQADDGKTTLTFPKKHILFSQGDASDAVFYIQAGKIKLTVVSRRGKEAVIVILEPGSFLGEECLAAQPVHLATATVVEDARMVRIAKRPRSCC
jgi:CRP-like cAMP-binding protein